MRKLSKGDRRSMAALRVLTLAVILLLGDSAMSQDKVRIQGVRVLDAEFEEIASIRDRAALRSLENLWGRLTPADGPSIPDWTHKLDIESDDIGGRWLYSSEGYVARLNKELKPIYHVPDSEAFEKLLGL